MTRTATMPPSSELAGDRHGQPERLREPAGRRDQRLCDRQPGGRRPVDAAQDGEPLTIAEEAADHASSSSSSSAVRVASS